MALFNTGNPTWDQGLNTFGEGLSSLFNPMKGAQAGYYGAEARKAQIDALTNINKLNAGAYATQAGLGGPVSPPTYLDPSNFPPNTNAAVLAPPSGLSGAFTPQPGQPPPMLTPPTPGAVNNVADVFAPGSTPNPKGVGTTGTPPQASSPAPNAGAPPAPQKDRRWPDRAGR